MVALFAVSSFVIKYLTTSFVQPSNIRNIATNIVPKNMKGLRRPQREVERSATTPTMGCIIRPESGPATHTREILDFVRPSSRR
jgi:hypothetical protein